MSDDATTPDSSAEDVSTPLFTDYRPKRNQHASRPSSVPAASPEKAPDGHALETLSPGSEFTHDRGLGSSISTGGSDGMNRRKERLHRFARLEDTGAETLRYLLPEIQRIATSLDLPGTVGERACRLARKFQAGARFTGASLEEWAGAFVFTAARDAGQYCPRSHLEDVIKSPAVGSRRSMQSKLSGCYSRIQTELGLSIVPVSPDEQVPAVAARVDTDLGPDVVRRASEIAQSYVETGGSGHPAGIGAAAIVVALHSMSESGPSIASLATAADVAVRTVYRHRDAMQELDVCQSGE